MSVTGPFRSPYIIWLVPKDPKPGEPGGGFLYCRARENRLSKPTTGMFIYTRNQAAAKSSVGPETTSKHSKGNHTAFSKSIWVRSSSILHRPLPAIKKIILLFPQGYDMNNRLPHLWIRWHCNTLKQTTQRPAPHPKA